MIYKIIVESVEEVVYSGPPMKFWTFHHKNGRVFETESLFVAIDEYKLLTKEHPADGLKVVQDVDIEIEVQARQ